MMTKIDIQFIDRVIKTTFLVTFLVALFSGYYYNYMFALGLIMGSLWNLINFWLIKKLIVSWLGNTPKNKSKLTIFIFVKFPLLYGLGVWIILSELITAGSFLCGFSLLFLVVFLKALGIIILTNRSSNGNSMHFNE